MMRTAVVLVCFLQAEAYNLMPFARPQNLDTLLSKTSSVPPILPILFSTAESNDVAQEAVPINLPFLSESSPVLPPKSRQLIEHATRRYTYGNLAVPTIPLTTDAWKSEYSFRSVSVTIEGETTSDESLVQVLSFGAYHRLPWAITLQVLDTIQVKMMQDVRGWESISFPEGLAIRTDRWRRRRYRIEQAALAIQQAMENTAPEQHIFESPLQVLAEMEQELGSTTVDYNKGQLPFFQAPGTWQRIRQSVKRQYAKLQRKGRAGILAYCVFNCIFYTTGFLLQWSKVATPAHSSIVLALTKKCGRVFASLYVAAQIVKIPKVLGALALTPVTQRMLDSLQLRVRVSENVALGIWVTFLLTIWITLCGLPMVADFAKLRQLALVDDQLLSLEIT